MKSSTKIFSVAVCLLFAQAGDTTTVAHADPSVSDTFVIDSGESPPNDFEALMQEYHGLPSIKHEQNNIEDRLQELKARVDALQSDNDILRKQLEYCQQGG